MKCFLVAVAIATLSTAAHAGAAICQLTDSSGNKLEYSFDAADAKHLFETGFAKNGVASVRQDSIKPVWEIVTGPGKQATLWSKDSPGWSIVSTDYSAVLWHDKTVVANGNCALNNAATSVPTAPATEEVVTEADFNKLFKETIAMATQQHAPVERFSDPQQVGWTQTVVAEPMVVVINVLLSPGSTFAIKHLCIGDTGKPGVTTCSSNLGESWVETKGPDGQWQQSQSVNLPWHRDLSQLAFD